MTPGWTQRRRTLAIGALLVLTAVTYRGVLANGYVWDDEVVVVKNRAVQSLWRMPDWVTTPRAVTSYQDGGNYRPVTVASYAVDYALWGGRAAGFHATNLAIHLAVVVFVYLSALRLWGADLPALTAAAWMALHPINAEAVSYITARFSTLAAVFVVICVVLYDLWAAGDARTTPGRRRAWVLGGALGCALAAFGAKESATVLPLLILVWDRARFGATVSWRTSVVRSAPFWLLLACWLALRATIIGSGPGAGSVPILGQALPFGAKILTAAATHSVWPIGLAGDYGWPMDLEPADVLWAVFGAAVLVMGGWSLFMFDRRMAWCAVWFGVSLLPVMALPFITRVALYQDHRAYLGEIGVSWLMGAVVWRGISTWGRRRPVRWALAASGMALLATAVWADAARTRAWADNERLWSDVLVKYPESAVARTGRGGLLLSAGRVEEAEQELLASLRLMPTSVTTRLLLGMTYAKQGDPDRAIAAYREILTWRPDYVEARIRLGLAYEDKGLVDQALGEYERALVDDPSASPALMFSAAIMEAQGRIEDAIGQLQRVAPDDPIYDDAQLAIGRLTNRGAPSNPMSSPQRDS